MPPVPVASARSWPRLAGVDALRGLAIVFVLLNHVNMQLRMADLPFTRGLPGQVVFSLFWNGQQGVQMFFAISGFLITSTSLRRWGRLADVKPREFYRLRFARIAPLLLLLLAVLSVLHLAHVPHFVVSAKTGGLGRALLAALTFHINLLEARRGYLPGSWDILWSLSVEEMFYLFFPLLCRLLRGRGQLAVLLVLFVIAGPFARSVAFNHNPVWREYSYLGGMDAIALGCLTAMLAASRNFKRAILYACRAAGTAILVFTLGFSLTAYRWGWGRNGLYMSLLAVGTCLLILSAAQTSRRPWAVLSPLLLLGQRSYEVYLTHIFIVIAFFGLFGAAGDPLRAVPVLFVAVIVVAGLLGELVARFYSEPMNRRLRAGKGQAAALGAVVEPGAG